MANLDSPPARKKQRLSSPSYEGLIDDLSQEELKAFDEIEAKYSQATHTSSAPRFNPAADLGSSQNATAAAYMDHVPKSTFPGFGSATIALVPSEDRSKQNSASGASPLAVGFSTGFASARHLPLHQRSPSPEQPPEEPDYDSWFAPTSEPAIVGFQTAKSVAGPDKVDLGFKTAGGKGVIALSADALEKAAKLMKEWEEQVEEEFKMTQPSTSALPDDTSNPFVSAATPQRPILRPVQNGLGFSTPSTPTPAGMGFSKASAGNAFTTPTSTGFDAKGKGKAFKPPSIARNSAAPGSSHITASPLNPNRPMTFQTPATKVPHPLSSTPVVSAAFRTPARAVAPQQLPRLGITPVKPGSSSSKVKKFSTPFKVGMKPGEPGRIQLQKEQEKKKSEQNKPPSAFSQELAAKPSSDKGKGKERSTFDFAPPPGRQSLSSCGLRPQTHTGDDLEMMGIPFYELSQITPDLAIYYCFHSVPSKNAPILTLGPDAALEELLRRGCSLATKPWVDNHWGLILWKLAGMVCLDPHRESKLDGKRWAWSEVLNQLLYRYERELNGGKRPPLKLIASKDSSASSPMIFCVSKITWSEAGVADDGAPILPVPELEVTDGWYRMRAEVDAPLARAIRRRVIRVGRKIAVVDARLSSARKEPYDILEAYDAISLKLSGNSSHLAPWHAKLGFQRKASVSTLHSLTPDGGNASVMNLVISKVYPVAYLEFVEDEDGKKHRQGPRIEKDENILRDRWKRKREAEESKLRFAMEKRLSQMEGYAERMEQKAGSRFHPGEDDYPPDKIDDVYDQLENATPTQASIILGRLTFMEAGWLARLISEKVMKEREQSRDEFESELDSICPPREVRDFRVIIARDARTEKRPGNRVAQITVWNVLNLVFDEGGKGGAFQEGQKFIVTNLIPTQQGAWMTSDGDEESEIYLSTRRDSKWTRLS